MIILLWTGNDITPPELSLVGICLKEAIDGMEFVTYNLGRPPDVPYIFKLTLEALSTILDYLNL